MKKIYVFTPNDTCKKCPNLLLGSILIWIDERKKEYVMLWACREKKCLHTIEEKEMDFQTNNGEKIIMRRIKN